jgi:hypothetical protein
MSSKWSNSSSPNLIRSASPLSYDLCTFLVVFEVHPLFPRLRLIVAIRQIRTIWSCFLKGPFYDCVHSVQPNTSMSPTMSRPHTNGKLYVDDMAPGTGDADLRRHFGRYGDVADIFIPKCRLTGAPRCCAFVQFSSAHDAGCALADRRHVINGREVPIISTLFFFFPHNEWMDRIVLSVQVVSWFSLWVRFRWNPLDFSRH